ncbi:NUDIX domain-containing protein [Nocardioides sp. URHA0032]|uniref:NUDIX domain-containing protein n=1 Tax=Nocardioides sp. URHA0032 TaxID=1380388 RepID=UPI003FA54092
MAGKTRGIEGADRGRSASVGGLCFDRGMIRVVVGALVGEGRVLLVHRGPDKRARPGLWDLPGRVNEAGESELGALARELHEELGVQVSTGSLSHLGRVTAGPADEPALRSAWLVREWHGTPTNVARPRNTTRSDGSDFRTCLLLPMWSSARLL